MPQKIIKYGLFFNTAAVLLNLLGVIRAKITSIWLGVLGVGILGQIITFYNFQTKVSDFGIFNLLVNRIGKITDENRLNHYLHIIQISIVVLVLVNFLLILVLYVLKNELSLLIFNSDQYVHLIFLLILLIPLFTISNFFETIARSHRDFKRLAIGQNLSRIIGIITIFPSVYFFGIEGIVYNFYIYLSFNALYFFFITRRVFPYRSLLTLNIKPHLLLSDLKTCLTDTFRKTLIFLSLFIFRIFIVHYIGLKNNGYFQSIWSISNYLNVLITAFAVYLLPLLSGIIDSDQFKKEINIHVEYLLYTIFPIGILIMIVPEFFLIVLFDKAFLVMKYPLVVLVFLKMWEAIYNIFTIAFYAQNKLKEFLITEFSRGISLIGFSFFAIQYFKLSGAILSIIIMNVVSWSVLTFFIRKNSMFHLTSQNIKLIFFLFIIACLLLIPIHNIIYLRIFISTLVIVLSISVFDLRKYLNVVRLFLAKKSNNIID